MAHANLGEVYVAQKKFAEAVPELEKAVTLQPSNPVLLISLGQSYIATNQTDKGMAQFEKAISLSPSPLTWNNIAYSLAEQDVQLDRADKYADAAINALQTQLRDVRLDSLRLQDLGAGAVPLQHLGHQGLDRIQARRSGTGGAVHQCGLASQRGGHHRRTPRGNLRKAGTARARDSCLPVVAGRRSAQRYCAGLAWTRWNRAKAESTRLRKPVASCNGSAPSRSGHRGRAALSSSCWFHPGRWNNVKFIKGNEELKGLSEVIEKTDLGIKFPASAEVRVVRRAVVTCGMPVGASSQATTAKEKTPAAAIAKPESPGRAEPCSIEVLPAEFVRTLD